MDPNEDIQPSIRGEGGLLGTSVPLFSPPINNNPLLPSSDCAVPSAVILRISTATIGDAFGFIYLSSKELINQATILAYFNGAGRNVTVNPCSNFEGFMMVENLLRSRNISFLSDLPAYILQLGCRVLEATIHHSTSRRPDLSWLPSSPLVPSTSLVSRGPTCLHPHAMMQALHGPTLSSICPDPDGLKAPSAPLFFSMGGHGSVSNFSPVTTSGMYFVRGVSPQLSYARPH